MKKTSFITRIFTTFALCLTAMSIAAAPGGKNGGIQGDSSIGKQLWKFNVISIPDTSNWGDSNASCNGARIFFEGTTGSITWKFDPEANKSFEIYDCDGTDSSASVIVDESIEVVVAVRLLGPYDSTLSIVCEEVEDEGNDDQFCVLPNTTNIHKTGKTNFNQILRTVSDGAYEEYLWSLSGDWKIFDVRIFENLD